MYYEINEEIARRAHEMMSFRDYVPGSKTAEYRGYVDRAYALADEAAKDRPDEADRIYSLADRYAKRLADNLNDESRIGCMCPSIMISGGSNFPVRKKERQNAAADRNRQEWNEIQKLLEKIESILTALDSGEYGAILRAKGMVPAEDGTWIYYDYVPEEHDIRTGKPMVTGKLCVIGAQLKEEKLEELFR